MICKKVKLGLNPLVQVTKLNCSKASQSDLAKAAWLQDLVKLIFLKNHNICLTQDIIHNMPNATCLTHASHKMSYTMSLTQYILHNVPHTTCLT